MTEKEKFILLTNSDTPKNADVVILLEGDGFTRIHTACKLLKKGFSRTLIFSGGIENVNYGSFPFSMCKQHILTEGVSSQNIIHESQSQNTRQQAENVIQMCLKNKWSKVILVATEYHQFRAFLTFLKVLIEQNLERVICIFNASAKADWFEETGWGRRIDLLEDEFDKIELYKHSGHIAEYKDALNYYQWVKQQ